MTTQVSDDQTIMRTRDGDMPYKVDAKIGRQEVRVVRMNKFSVEMLAAEHAAPALYEYKRGTFFALIDEFGEEQRFYEGDVYIERPGDFPRTMTVDEFEAVGMVTPKPLADPPADPPPVE